MTQAYVFIDFTNYRNALTLLGRVIHRGAGFLDDATSNLAIGVIVLKHMCPGKRGIQSIGIPQVRSAVVRKAQVCAIIAYDERLLAI